MTVKEKLLEMICLESGYSKDEVEKIFDIVREYDVACFRSQMGDYDHPEERRAARKVLNEKIKDFDFTTATKIWNVLGNAWTNPYEDEIACLYHKKFHSLMSEYEDGSK